MENEGFFKSTDTSSVLKRCHGRKPDGSKCHVLLRSRHLSLCDDCFEYGKSSRDNHIQPTKEKYTANGMVCKHCYRSKNDHRYVDGACPASEKMSVQCNWMDTTFEKV